VAFSPDGLYLVSGSQYGDLCVYDTSTMRICRRSNRAHHLRVHTGVVLSLAFSPSDSCILGSGSADATVRLWNTGTGQQVLKLRGHTHRINSVAFSPSGRHVASASSDGTVRVWDVCTGAAITLCGHTNGVISVAFSPDGTRIASNSEDGFIRVWD
ncbi:WD40 repeat-like protein, partial [Auricularia subglabra TFB-10046 SS5]